MSGIVKIVTVAAAAAFALRLLLLLFERVNLYFPTRRIEATPAVAGLAYEDVRITTADGVTIHGWFVPAPVSRRGIVFFHGNAGNISHRIDTLRIFHDLGLNTLIIDYRGYGKSGGRPSEKGLYRDAEAAFDYTASRPEIDAASIIAFGRSLGGAVAVELASRRRLRAIVVESAFSSTAAIAKDLFPFLPAGALVTQRFDSLGKVGAIEIPKLFVHSRDDEIIPFSHAERLFRTAAPPKEFHAMRGSHNGAFLLPENDYAAVLGRFLERTFAAGFTDP